ncbi:hypothetical protein RvY_11259-2 [Ramazzottius varieornatus]|uniref:RH1 domain-containing protein n=1 Tax=Ramazzottius varieornatus TaxID=947166 RepID=A0A1D1VFI6_RAMVA|nr:hypothetical protein RvY_11259-2 [Ramazzottius varieornatus]
MACTAMSGRTSSSPATAAYRRSVKPAGASSPGLHSQEAFEMSEKVQALARDVYAEFEKLIVKYGEKVVEELMPQVVNVLEVLEQTYNENEEHKAEIELLREDNEQLAVHFEREKQLRKQLDRKTLEAEDTVEEEKRKQQEKLESLEAIVRILELKSKNAADQISRFEDKEREAKKDNEKLYERYSQLFKAHAEHLERTRMLLDSGGNSDDLSSLIANRREGSEPTSAQQEEEYEGLMRQSRAVLSAAEERFGQRVEKSSDVRQYAQTVPYASQMLRNASDISYPEMSMEADEDNVLESSMERKDESDSEAEGGDGDKVRLNSSAGGEGISREVEELIRENNNLLATKNALNIVKDDLIAQLDELTGEKHMLKEEIHSIQEMKNKLKERIAYLEDNAKKLRDFYEKKLVEASESDENVPYGQQKRFTRLEMARVVQEKNKYKEQLMELQDEAIRSKQAQISVGRVPERQRKSGLWKFFGNLFGTSQSRDNSSVRYGTDSGSTASASPPQSVPSRSPPPPMYTEPMDITQIVDLSQEISVPTWTDSGPSLPSSSTIMRQEQAGRVQAYGWSVPSSISSQENAPNQVGIPLPVYCRPLVEKDPDMKIWCAVGVTHLTPPTIAVQGASPTSPARSLPGSIPAEVQSPMQRQLQAFEKTPPLSSIWICSSTHSAGKISIVDASKPNDVLESFNVCSSHLLCIACVPAVNTADYPSAKERDHLRHSSLILTAEREAAIKTGSAVPDLGSITYVSCATGSSPMFRPDSGTDTSAGGDSSLQNELQEPAAERDEEEQLLLEAERGKTVWIGSQRGGLFVFSATRSYRKRMHKVALPDAVLCIIHIRGRVFASLADGTIAVFHRTNDGAWDTANYHQLNLGQPDHAIRSMVAVRNEAVWCGCKNKVYIVDPVTLEIKDNFEAVPKQDSAIRQMAWIGEGVWVSIRLDNTLRLFHTGTHQHLQDLNIEPLSSMMTGKSRLGLSIVRITAMTISCMRLWIGTSTGVVLSAPFSNGPDATATSLVPSGRSGVSCIVPFCSPSLVQVSYHGHKEEVKFFVSVPGAPGHFQNGAAAAPSGSRKNSAEAVGPLADGGMTLLMSGGEGYIDFRFDDSEYLGDDSDRASIDSRRSHLQQTPSRTDRSHLTVWQIPMTDTEHS